MNDPIYDVACATFADHHPTLFVARASGLYRSQDRGVTWENVNPVQVTSIGISPNCRQDQTVFAGVVGGVTRSTNSGLSWQHVSFGSPSPIISAIAISPSFADDATVLVGTIEDRVFRSCDGGLTWMASNTGLFDSAIIAIATSDGVSRDHDMVLSGDSGVYHSGNGGVSWRDLASFAPESEVVGLAMCHDADRERLVLAASENGMVYQSHGPMSTWSRIAGLDEGIEILDLVLLGSLDGRHEIALTTVFSVVFLAMEHDVVRCSREVARSSSNIVSSSVVKEPDGAISVLLGLADGSVTYDRY